MPADDGCRRGADDAVWRVTMAREGVLVPGQIRRGWVVCRGVSCRLSHGRRIWNVIPVCFPNGHSRDGLAPDLGTEEAAGCHGLVTKRRV
jgi:hypothetical protein